MKVQSLQHNRARTQMSNSHTLAFALPAVRSADAVDLRLSRPQTTYVPDTPTVLHLRAFIAGTDLPASWVTAMPVQISAFDVKTGDAVQWTLDGGHGELTLILRPKGRTGDVIVKATLGHAIVFEAQLRRDDA